MLSVDNKTGIDEKARKNGDTGLLQRTKWRKNSEDIKRWRNKDNSFGAIMQVSFY